MKKACFFLPAAAMTGVCACLRAFSGPAAPVLLAVLALLWCGGLLLSRRVIWGAFCGAFAGAALIWQGARAGILPVLLLGTALLLFYMFFVCAVYQKG